MNQKHHKGWRPDLPDKRDRYYHNSMHFHADSKAPRPTSIDLRNGNMPPVEDQGQLGSCTAFGSLAAYNFAHHLQGSGFLEPSHLFAYYNARMLEGTVNEDSGATIRDAVKAIAKFGAVPESELPYIIAKFKHKPSAHLYTEGAKHLAIQYLRVESDQRKGGLTHLQACLAAGYPVIFGSTLYDSFENPGPDADGMIPMPQPEEGVLGGHCQLICGYDNHKQAFLVRNSWGESWALQGYEWIPYAYILDTDYTSDCWTLRKIEV